MTPSAVESPVQPSLAAPAGEVPRLASATPTQTNCASALAAATLAVSAVDPVDKRIILAVSAMLTLLAALMVSCVILQWQKYDSAIHVAVHASPPDHAAALSYARALDAAVIKTSALMLAFVVVFLGALYVLRSATTVFGLGLSGQGFSGTLQTASPGLVMVTLGLLIVAIAVLARSDINYNSPTYWAPPATGPNLSVDGQEFDRPPATPTLQMETDDGGKQ